jgi:hypothetical protein
MGVSGIPGIGHGPGSSAGKGRKIEIRLSIVKILTILCVICVCPVVSGRKEWYNLVKK